MMGLDSELNELLEALGALSAEIADQFPDVSESLGTHRERLAQLCSGQLDLNEIRIVTQEIKDDLFLLCKLDLRSDNLESARSLIFIFQEAKHQEEIKSRTSR